MKIKQLFFLTFLAAACAGPDYTPTMPSSENVVIADRLSNQRVNAFAEDTDGHIWIGTFRGLNKYTIHDYHQYFCPDDTLGLPDNQITSLHRSSDGLLWIGTANGVAQRLDDGTFRRIPMEEKNLGISEIIETRDGKMLFNAAGRLFRYDEASGHIVSAIPDYGGYSTLVGADGRIWTSTLLELRCFDAADLSPVGTWPTRHMVYHIAMSATGEIWLSGMGEISIFDPRTERWLDIPKSILQEPRLIRGDIDILFSNGADMLLHTITDGMFCYSQASGLLMHQSSPDFPYDIPDFEIRTLFRDSRGNLWFGSTDQGFSISYADKDGFNNQPYLIERFKRKSVTSLTTDHDGHLWISTLNDGLFVYDLKTRELRQVDLNHLVPDSNIGYIRCSGIICDAQGELWLAMMEKYQVLRCRYDGRKLRLIDRIYSTNPIAISQDDLNRIWISGYTPDLVRYDKDTRTTQTFPLPGGQRTNIPALLQVSPGRMLVASHGNPVAEVFTNSGEIAFMDAPDEEWRHSIRHAVINPTCLFKDSAGDIWLGTVGNGLLHRERSTMLTRPVEGTSCPDICSIEEDRQGNIWISTMYGLSRYDRSTGAVTNYFESDGLGGNQFYDRSSCILPDGTLIFGGTHGLTCFNPLDISRKVSRPVTFEDLKIHNSLVHPGPDAPIDRELTRRPSVTIRHEQNGFSISYAALDYTPHSNVRYQYKMDGFDDYWIEAGTAHETYYANLPAGHYQFRVRTADATDDGQALDIRVLPPWYRSWWALVLFGLLTAGVCFFLWTVYRRIHRVRKEAARHIREVRREQERTEQEKAAEKRLNRVQMNYFANVAHEFRTPLTMIAGPVEQLAASPGIQGQDRQLVGIVQRNAAWMLSLVGQLLDFNRIGDKKLQLKVAEGDVVATLRESADMFRFNAESKGIEFNTHGLEDTFTMWRDADKVAKITMNLLSNAMKFTQPGGKVALSFDVLPREEVARDFPLTDADTDTQYAQIRVSDTGRGIPEDQLEKIFERFHQAGRGDAAGTGIGLYYSRALAELHHGYIHARNRDSGGAVFTFILPVNAAAYSEDERTTEEPQRLTIPLPDAAPERPAEDEGADKRRIVVVDDDIDVANYVKVLLSPYYQVIVHFDADSALKALEEEAPDLVVSDVVMPGKSGYELCEAIKGNLQLSHIPVILVTAKVAVESQVQGLDKGADAYVTKPFNPSYLLALVKSLLENRDKLRRQLGSVTSTEEIAPEALSPRDNAFMKELYELMDNELANQELDINRITEMMRISRTKFYYKVKGLTGENPGVFFKRYKLNRAADLLKEGKHNMSEIAWMTGFNTLSHFSTSFKKQFGVPPSEFTG